MVPLHIIDCLSSIPSQVFLLSPPLLTQASPATRPTFHVHSGKKQALQKASPEVPAPGGISCPQLSPRKWAEVPWTAANTVCPMALHPKILGPCVFNITQQHSSKCLPTYAVIPAQCQPAPQEGGGDGYSSKCLRFAGEETEASTVTWLTQITQTDPQLLRDLPLLTP